MMSLPLDSIILGDCVDVMRGFPDDSVDLAATDPPYGLGYMNKAWDKTLPPKAAFEEMHRILKPGALAFVMSSPRQDLNWRMGRMLEEAGFDLSQSFVSWIYANGFPKAYDISKGIDDKLGLKQAPVAVNPSSRPNSKRRGGGGFDSYQGNGSAGLQYITTPTSDDAKKWEGWKAVTGLKPALEPIFMVQKPVSEKTIVDNVLKWGTGAINMEGCRIPLTSDSDRAEVEGKNAHADFGSGPRVNHGYSPDLRPRADQGNYDSSKGRLPANLIVSDGALDDGAARDEGHRPAQRGASGYGGGLRGQGGLEDARLGAPGLSRYFDLDAWAMHHGIYAVPKPSTAERDRGLVGEKFTPKSKFNKSNGQTDRFDGATPQKRRNIHPTVKPVKLMAFLISLGCPPGGVVLDPFVGSGTTCVAARQLHRRYIGIEIMEEYHRIASAKLASML